MGRENPLALEGVDLIQTACLPDDKMKFLLTAPPEVGLRIRVSGFLYDDDAIIKVLTHVLTLIAIERRLLGFGFGKKLVFRSLHFGNIRVYVSEILTQISSNTRV